MMARKQRRDALSVPLYLVHPHAAYLSSVDHLLHLWSAVSHNHPITSWEACLQWSRAWGSGGEEARTRTWSWSRLNGQLLRWVATANLPPPPDFLFPVCSHGYTTRLRASSVCAYADLAVALWFITFLVDAHRSIRAHTSTLNPKAATAGDYRERKWLLKCLSPTHTALDREKVWITRYWLLQSISHLNSAKDPK